jgi:hypothetical protein
MAKELNIEDMGMIAGGKVNPNGDGKGINIDKIINGKNYEKIAEWVMRLLKLYPDRKRAVQNDVDINDVDL